MNLPNKLSILRVALIPVIVLCMYAEPAWAQAAALVIFAIAAFTDWLDGQIARKHGIVTNFGKFIDPVADKLLVLSTMIALCGLGRFPAWACIAILFRELAVDGLRLVSVEQGRVIAAGSLGKIKTTIQLITLIVYLLSAFMAVPEVVKLVMMLLSVAMTLISGADYFVRNRDALAGDKARE